MKMLLIGLLLGGSVAYFMGSSNNTVEVTNDYEAGDPGHHDLSDRPAIDRKRSSGEKSKAPVRSVASKSHKRSAPAASKQNVDTEEVKRMLEHANEEMGFDTHIEESAYLDSEEMQEPQVAVKAATLGTQNKMQGIAKSDRGKKVLAQAQSSVANNEPAPILANTIKIDTRGIKALKGLSGMNGIFKN